MKPAIKAVMMMMMMTGIAWVHAAREPVMVRMIRTARIHEALVTMTVIISAMVTVAKTMAKTMTKMAAEMTEPTVAHP